MRMSLVGVVVYSLVTLAFPAKAEEKAITAMSWNIEWFPGTRPDPSRREAFQQTKAARKLLEEVVPDILFAQELTDEKAFAKLVKAVPFMDVHVYSKFVDSRSGELARQQCGIASTLEADSAWFEAFKPVEGMPNLRRGFAFAALKHPQGGLLMCYSVHLKSNGGSDTPEGEKDIAVTRAESVRQLLAHKAEMEKRFADKPILGWIIGGDMNTNHDGQFPLCTVIEDLVKGGFHNTWSETPKEKRLTWRNHPDDTRFKPTTFDYFMTIGVKPVQATMMPEVPVEVSDHAPVLLEIVKP
ncbi:MAG: hypothetical protein AAGI48_17290 [Verrucomicrobiota bacterium]